MERRSETVTEPQKDSELSEKHRRFLEFITAFRDERGYPPTIREIGSAVGIKSTSVVNYNLNRLAKDGYISRSKDVSRGIKILKPLPKSSEE